MKKFLWGMLVAAGAAVGYAVYRKRSSGYRTFVLPEGYAGTFRGDIALDKGPWSPMTLYKPLNNIREPGKRYMVRVYSHGAEAWVEGFWRGETGNNAGKLEVDRVVSADRVMPVVPFDLQVPKASNPIYDNYLEETKWSTLHPTAISEIPWGIEEVGLRPKVSAPARFALREVNEHGNAVLFVQGKVLADDSPLWPKEEGSPDKDRVLLSVDKIVRAVRGQGEVSLPPAFVVPIEQLVAV